MDSDDERDRLAENAPFMPDRATIVRESAAIRSRWSAAEYDRRAPHLAVGRVELAAITGPDGLEDA